MYSRLRLISILATLATLTSCGTDDSTTNDNPTTGNGATAATAAEVATHCDAVCGWDLRCSTATDPASPTCQSNCSLDFSKPEVYRSDTLATMRQCFEALGCGGGDDSCTGQGILAANPNPATDPGYLSCRSRYEACSASDPGNFSDDICSWRLLLTDAVQAPLDSCLALACTAVSACVDALLGQS